MRSNAFKKIPKRIPRIGALLLPPPYLISLNFYDKDHHSFTYGEKSKYQAISFTSPSRSITDKSILAGNYNVDRALNIRDFVFKLCKHLSKRRIELLFPGTSVVKLFMKHLPNFKQNLLSHANPLPPSVPRFLVC